MIVRNRWTKEEKQYLKENYNFLTIEKLMKKLPRHNEGGIRQKARAMKLTRKHIDPKEYRNPKYKGMSIIQQARAMGVTAQAVYYALVLRRKKHRENTILNEQKEYENNEKIK